MKVTLNLGGVRERGRGRKEKKASEIKGKIKKT